MKGNAISSIKWEILAKQIDKCDEMIFEGADIMLCQIALMQRLAFNSEEGLLLRT